MIFKSAGLFFAAGLIAASATAAPVLPRDGDYLSTAYISALEKTKSHHMAWETDGPQQITVSREKKGLVLELIYNWHEGTGTDPQEVIPIDSTHFRFKGDKSVLTYQFVGNAAKFIASRILTGTYADRRGQKYVFGADGDARFPDRRFRYELYLDMVFEPCDEYTDLSASKQGDYKNYGFEWTGHTLSIYPMTCWQEDSPGCVADKKHPIAVLHRVGG